MILIVQNHNYHRSFFFHSSNIIAGTIYSTQQDVLNYFRLKQTNQQLAAENLELRKKSEQSFLKTDQSVFTFQDTLYQRRFTYTVARVINNTVSSRNNYLTLDKGRKQGINTDMGVITAQGVIGIINKVSSNFSTAVSLLHSESQISAKIKRNNHLGTLIWEGFDYKSATMLYIPTHLDLSLGDTIVTSGFSHIFPENIELGTISDFEIRRGDNFYTLTIDLFADFNQLDYVYVVKDLFRQEIKNLENQIITDSD